MSTEANGGSSSIQGPSPRHSAAKLLAVELGDARGGDLGAEQHLDRRLSAAADAAAGGGVAIVLASLR